MKNLFQIWLVVTALVLSACSTEMDDVEVNAPTISLGNVTDITGTSAVINANIILHGGKVAYYLIHYGTSESSLTETAKYTVTTENPSLILTNLQANTTYYYQLVASSGYSEVTSEVHSFDTLNPTIALSEASDVTGTTALFQATLNTEGSTVTSCMLRYGRDASAMTNAVAITDIQKEIQIPISGLQINTTYYCELILVMGQVQLRSELRTFTTIDPIVTLSEAMNVTSSSAVFQMNVSTGSEGNPQCVLRYGVDASSLTEELVMQDMQDVLLTGLNPSTTYYIQLVLLYGAMEKTSEMKSFFTPKRNAEDAIVFADSQVERLCVEYWDTNGDGSLSYREASLVASLEDRFVENVDIVSFNELRYFSGLREVGGFSDCLFLEHITIPDGVTIIGPDAFLRCSNLKSISIPEGVTTIEWEAFYECSSLTSITLPESLTNISGRAFYGCGSLTNINIPESVTDIGEEAFYECRKLKSISIPRQFERIRQAVFGYCSSLEHVEIPNGVKVIEIDAFLGCSSLTNISIPETVKIIGAEAF